MAEHDITVVDIRGEFPVGWTRGVRLRLERPQGY